MKLIVLWTDVLIYLLIGLTLLLLVRICRSQELRQTWRQVINRPLNIVAIVILLAFSSVGFLDTVHYQTQDANNVKSDIVSLLDSILAPLADHSEMSYSAPFALYGFTKEALTLPNGIIVRDYPRLKFAGANLKNPHQQGADIKHRLALVGVQTLFIGGIAGLLLLLLFKPAQLTVPIFIQQVLKGKTTFPWRSFLLAIITILFVIIFMRHFMLQYHIFGTSQVGEDVLYQTLKSIRTGLVIGTLTTLVTLPFAILFGMLAGYFRGKTDDIIQYVYTTLSSIPGVLLIAAAVLTLDLVIQRNAQLFQTVLQRSDARLLALCMILGITSWTTLCRLIRGETLKLCQMDFITAAHTMGTSHTRILLKHLLPNLTYIILITVALDFSGLVLAEAVLSYVGVGVDPSTYSWGNMINSARLEMARVPVVWWSLMAAFVFMFVLVLAANIFADAVRDAFDPRMAK